MSERRSPPCLQASSLAVCLTCPPPSQSFHPQPESRAEIHSALHASLSSLIMDGRRVEEGDGQKSTPDDEGAPSVMNSAAGGRLRVHHCCIHHYHCRALGPRHSRAWRVPWKWSVSSEGRQMPRTLRGKLTAVLPPSFLGPFFFV